MGKKRKTLPDCPASFTIEQTQGLHGVSEDARRKIYNATCRALKRPDEQLKKSKWNETASSTCPDFFVPIELEGVNGDPVVVYIAQIKLLLQHIVTVCKGYALEIENCLTENPDLTFQLIVYNDEAQAGNVLAPVSGKKASLWYFCLRELGWRWCDQVWHPICLVPHNDFDNVAGGFSAITLKIFRTIMAEELHAGFPVQLPNKSTLLKCEIKWVISDLDSIRAALNLKGSAAIRCCLFCRNCVNKNVGVEVHNDYFHSIACSEFHKFDDQTDEDIFQVWDYLLGEKRRLNKSQLQTKEKTTGFNVCEKALLSDRTVREQIPPWSFLLDTMHLYWSNGIVSWEVNALYNFWSNTNRGNLLDFFALNWKTTQVDSNTKSWRRSLCHEAMFSGSSYKGSASNLQAFWPLFHHFLNGCLGTDDAYKAEMDSMHALRRITIELRNLPHDIEEPLDNLQALQQKHQDLVVKAFGHQFMKPKHHARIHVVKQYIRCGFVVTCMAGERKHKMYKSHIGLSRYDGWNNNSAGQFGHIVTKQIYVHHVEQLKQFEFGTCLVGSSTVDPSLGALLGKTMCNVSTGVKHAGRTISAGDMLMGHYPGIVVDAIQTDTDFFVRLQCTRLEKHDEFVSFWKKTNEQKIVAVQRLGRSPQWWLEPENDIVRCLH